MRQVNIHEAKTNLSKLVDDAAAGESIILARAGKPVAMLSPLPARKARRFGTMAGQIKIADDFDDPLPQEILALFEGRGE